MCFGTLFCKLHKTPSCGSGTVREFQNKTEKLAQEKRSVESRGKKTRRVVEKSTLYIDTYIDILNIICIIIYIVQVAPV